MKENNNIIEVIQLKKYFQISDRSFSGKILKAVDGVTFSVKEGETFGLVGESGCGKSTVGRTILNLYKPTSGKIFYKGKEILCKSEMKKFRKNTSMVFQDPYSSLDPRMTVTELIGEPMDIHGLYKTKAERKEKIFELMERTGLRREYANRYPHEFSGGQRQRIGIARSLAANPEFIVCDEPVSALDVSVQAQIINLFSDLKKESNLTYLFIAHDLLVVRHISQRVGVMYLGKLVEIAETSEIFSKPLHPYTKALLSAVPIPDPALAQKKKRIILSGEIPGPMNIPQGCSFSTRCVYSCEICRRISPPLKEVSKEHFVACHRAGEKN